MIVMALQYHILAPHSWNLERFAEEVRVRGSRHRNIGGRSICLDRVSGLYSVSEHGAGSCKCNALMMRRRGREMSHRARRLQLSAYVRV